MSERKRINAEYPCSICGRLLKTGAGVRSHEVACQRKLNAEKEKELHNQRVRAYQIKGDAISITCEKVYYFCLKKLKSWLQSKKESSRLPMTCNHQSTKFLKSLTLFLNENRY